MKTFGVSRSAKRFAVAVLLPTAAAGSLLVGGFLQGPSRAQTEVSQPAAGELEVNREGHSLKPSGLALNNLPTARFDFSIEKRDPRTGLEAPFGGLKASDIEVKLNNQAVKPTDLDLKLTGSNPAGVIIMLDGSGSMVSRLSGVDKLGAAKSAVTTFINSLGRDDSVAIGTFDESPYWLAPLTTDKSQLTAAINSYQINPAGAKYTRLYHAAEAAIREAVRRKVRNVILISDGWEDSPESRLRTGAELEAFKAEEEDKITRLSRDNDVRVFTIAIGDELGEGLARVDRASLERLARGANGGDPVYICVPQPGMESNCSETVSQGLLERKLKQTLEQIRQSFRYGYSLEMRLGPNLARDVEHKLLIDSSVALPRAANERERRVVHLPIEYVFRWPAGEQAGTVIRENLYKPAIFIQTAPLAVSQGKLALLYALMMALLLSAGVIPLIVGWIIQAGRTSGAVTTLKARSQLVGKMCEHERSFGQTRKEWTFKEGDAVIVCPKCTAPHHLQCWIFNKNKCFNRNCAYPMEIPANILSKHGIEVSELRPA